MMTDSPAAVAKRAAQLTLHTTRTQRALALAREFHDRNIDTGNGANFFSSGILLGIAAEKSVYHRQEDQQGRCNRFVTMAAK